MTLLPAIIRRRFRAGGSSSGLGPAAYALAGGTVWAVVHKDNGYYWHHDLGECDLADFVTEVDPETAFIPAALMPSTAGGISVVGHGRMTYADNGLNPEGYAFFWAGINGKLRVDLITVAAYTGWMRAVKLVSGNFAQSGTSAHYYSPSTDVPLHFAARWSATTGAVQFAVDGVSLTETTAVAGVPDLAGEDCYLPSSLLVYYDLVVIYTGDIGTAGVEAGSASSYAPDPT